MKKIVIGNWKLHLNIPESNVLIEKFKKELKGIKNTDIVVCPSFLDIYLASVELKKSNIKLGAQDTFYETEGAFTGEVSPYALSHYVDFVIVGHSERRMYFNESDKTVARKAEAAYANGILPIICVGETLHENQDGLSKVVVMNQVETGLSHMTSEEIANSVIAYEPIWAIGTGKVCKVSDAEKMIINIRNLVKALYGAKTSEKIRIVYGGSVTPETVVPFAKSNKIDGFLVGGASVDDKKFSEIVKIVDSNIKEEKNVKQKVKK